MKFFPALIVFLLRPGMTRRNIRFLFWFTVILVALVAVFTVLFHIIMEREGQQHSYLSGLYWTLVTMSTLGFGDITFKSDVGRFFSVMVLITGMVFLLVLLPFTFIEFFYSPFVKAQHEARAPRAVSKLLKNHVILTHYDAVSAAFIRRLEKYGFPYVLVVKDIAQALLWHDMGLNVVVADLEDPDGFVPCGFERAAMVAATGDDFANTSIAFTARQLSAESFIATTANSKDSVDVLELAGSNHVIQLGDILGAALARRTIATDAQAHIIGNFGTLRIAEAMVAGTPLVGKSLAGSRLRELVGITVVGLWQRGKFNAPSPGTILTADVMLVLAGSEKQIAAYNGLFCIYHLTHAPAVIIGAGRVGRATARNFDEMELDYRIVEQDAVRVRDSEKYVYGSAAHLGTLERAGIREAPAVLITTRRDDVNIYLAIYCRKLRPDIQIVARANTEANVARLHAAGADVVMSYASMGSNILFNLLRRENTLLVAEGINIFRVPVPKDLVGKSIAQSLVRTQTGCSIIALQDAGREMMNPDPGTILEARYEMIVVGTLVAETTFFDLYPTGKV
ncbi:MAG TPA: NAD-binding protein [Chthoniobacterales bacterium]